MFEPIFVTVLAVKKVGFSCFRGSIFGMVITISGNGFHRIFDHISEASPIYVEGKLSFNEMFPVTDEYYSNPSIDAAEKVNYLITI